MQLCSEGSQEFLVLQIFTHTVSDDADDLIDGNPGMEMEILLQKDPWATLAAEACLINATEDITKVFEWQNHCCFHFTVRSSTTVSYIIHDQSAFSINFAQPLNSCMYPQAHIAIQETIEGKGKMKRKLS